MAKVSLMDYELYRQGETGAIRARMRGVRDASKIIATPQVRAFIANAENNSIAKVCGGKMNERFGEHHGADRGKAMKACLRSEGFKQLGAKIRAGIRAE
ncbi:MAG: hypothetical protein QW478_12560 [Candidatus Micrarchaeaceae archaeon]